jgi:hypothetical protein
MEIVYACICGRLGQKDDPIRGYAGGLGGQIVDGLFLPIELTEHQLRGLAQQPYVSFLSANVLDNPREGYIKYPDMSRTEMAGIIGNLLVYEMVVETEPYRAAARLQQEFINIHPVAGVERAANGRVSRILMNWELERRDCYPAILPDFDMDLYSTLEEWMIIIRAGSMQYGTIRQMIGSGVSDPIELMGLSEIKAFHDTYIPSPETIVPVYQPDVFHPHWVTDAYLREFRTTLEKEGIAPMF